VHERALAQRLASRRISCLVIRYARRSPGLYHDPARRGEAERRIGLALAWLQDRTPGGPGRVGLLGLSLGGGLALRVMLESSRPIGATVVWYGVYPDLPARLLQRTDPLLILQGERDDPSFVQSAIEAGRAGCELALYPGAKHQFDLLQPGSDAATNAWESTVAFFGRYLAS